MPMETYRTELSRQKLQTTMAQQIARAACALERRRTGQVPRRVTVVFRENTLVITLHGILSATEKELARTPAGARLIQEYHCQLFKNSDSFRQEIKAITGVEVREGTEEVVTTSGVVVKAFTTGTVVQFYLLGGHLPADIWSERGRAQPRDSFRRPSA
jgi:uncharacterized protein YbcI